MHETTQTSLSLDDAVWDTHLAAQSREEKNHFNWIDVMRDDDKLGLLLFHQFGDGIGSSTDDISLLAWGFFLAGGLCLSLGLQAVSLGQFRLWAVLFQQFEQLDAGLLVQCLRKLVDWWRNLQALLQNGLVTLDADVFWPSDETRQIAFGLDVVAYF